MRSGALRGMQKMHRKRLARICPHWHTHRQYAQRAWKTRVRLRAGNGDVRTACHCILLMGERKGDPMYRAPWHPVPYLSTTQQTQESRCRNPGTPAASIGAPFIHSWKHVLACMNEVCRPAFRHCITLANNSPCRLRAGAAGCRPPRPSSRDMLGWGLMCCAGGPPATRSRTTSQRLLADRRSKQGFSRLMRDVFQNAWASFHVGVLGIQRVRCLGRSLGIETWLSPAFRCTMALFPGSSWVVPQAIVFQSLQHARGMST